MENYPEVTEPKNGKKFTVGKLFKWLAILIILLVYAILIVRCTMYSDDKIVSKVIYNDITVSAYNSDPENFKVEQYGMQSPWVAIDDGRMVEFNYLYHIEAAKQLQFSVKYNVDIAPNINEDGIPFKFRLVDSDKNVYEDYFFEQKRKFNHNYIRICFNGIELVSNVSDDTQNETDQTETSEQTERKTCTLYIDRLEDNGEYTELCKYVIYDGSDISKTIDFELK